MYWRLISLEWMGLFKFEYSLSNILIIQSLCKIYCRNLGQDLMQFDEPEKKRNETTNYSIYKLKQMDTSIQRLLKIKSLYFE